MIKFEFKDAKGNVDLSANPNSFLCERFVDIVRIPLGSVACPVHGNEAHATIQVDLQKSLSDWIVYNTCCDVFREEIESAMPFPWTGTPHHLQP